MPEGPLTYSNTTQESVTLSWNPPSDDGGSDITGTNEGFCGVILSNVVSYKKKTILPNLFISIRHWPLILNYSITHSIYSSNIIQYSFHG